MNAGKKISGEFVMARGDGAEVLELIEIALDEIALIVQREIAGEWFFGRNVKELSGV